MTPQVCYLECSNLGYRYYGLKNGDECHCGANPNFHGKFTGIKVSNDACNKNCTGDSSTKCGGETTLSFYTKQFDNLRPLNQNCQEPKKWTQFYSATDLIKKYRYHKQDEKYALLRAINGNLRDINLKGSLDLCGAVCESDSATCNDNQKRKFIDFRSRESKEEIVHVESGSGTCDADATDCYKVDYANVEKGIYCQNYKQTKTSPRYICPDYEVRYCCDANPSLNNKILEIPERLRENTDKILYRINDDAVGTFDLDGADIEGQKVHAYDGDPDTHWEGGSGAIIKYQFKNSVTVRRISIKKSRDGTKRDRYNDICLWIDRQATQSCTTTRFGFEQTDQEQGDFVNFEEDISNVETVELKFANGAVVHEFYIFYEE